MIIKETNISGVFTLEPRVFGDSRGYFLESFNQQIFNEKIGKISFVQDNESSSVRGVLRGLHYQIAPFAQSKLVRVIQGSVIDVVVDIRKYSPTFGQHLAVELSEVTKNQLFIPAGLAHGFVVLSETAVFAYKVDNYYAPNCERGIAFNDPALGIDWKIPFNELTLSKKDMENPLFANAQYFEL